MTAPRWNWIVIAVILAGGIAHPGTISAQSARKVVGWSKDFQTAESESQRLGRPLLIHFHADWCVPCRRMDRDVLNSPELASQFQRSFVGVKVDADREPQLLKRFEIRSLPADVVLSADGRVLIQTQGYQDKKDYVGRLARLGARLNPIEERVAAPERPETTLPARNQIRQEPEAPPFEKLAGLDGYSPVSLYNWREWRKGSAEYSGDFKGVSYLMATQAELEEFKADPEKYVPRLLGCDPVVLLKTDRAVPGNTKYGAYFDGALYLFESQESRVEFKKAPMRFIKTRHVLNADEIERAPIRQSAKPSTPAEPVRQ